MQPRKHVPTRADFGHALRQLRALRGLTQEDMLMATSRRHMSRVEQGHQIPSVRVIEALAESLQIHPLTLIAAAYCVNLDEASIKLYCICDQLDLQRMVQDHIENGSVSEFS